MCAKREYHTKAQAKRALKRIQSQAQKNRVAQVYRCRDCEFWHMSSNPVRHYKLPQMGQNPTWDRKRHSLESS